MGKLVDAEITLKYSNGRLTIASTPNTIKGDGLLSYLDLAECAIIGANYKNLNEAMDIAAEHASAIIATVMHTAGDEKTSPKMGAIVHAAQVSPFYLQCVIQKPDAPSFSQSSASASCVALSCWVSHAASLSTSWSKRMSIMLSMWKVLSPGFSPPGGRLAASVPRFYLPAVLRGYG